MPFRFNRFRSDAATFDLRPVRHQNRWRRNETSTKKQQLLALKDESISIYPNLKVRAANRRLNRSPVRLQYKNFPSQQGIPKIRINAQIEDDSVNVIEPGDQDQQTFSVQNASVLKRVIQNQPKTYNRVRLNRAAGKGLKRLGAAKTSVKFNVGGAVEKQLFNVPKVRLGSSGNNPGSSQGVSSHQRAFNRGKTIAKVFQAPAGTSEDEDEEMMESAEDVVQPVLDDRFAGPSTFMQQQRVGEHSATGGLWAVKVGNLPATVSREDIEQLFQLIGPLQSARFIRRGLAIAVYAAKTDALKAHRTYNNREIDGVPMRVEVVPYVVSEQKATNSSAIQSSAASAANKNSTNPKPNRDLIISAMFNKKQAGPAVTFTVKV